MVFNQYRYRPGRSSPVPAQTVGEELEKLGISERPVAPAEIVDAARPKSAPLHPVFEWRDKVAAELYREDQARELTRSVEVYFVEDETQQDNEPREAQIAFVSVGTSGSKGTPGYISTSVAMADEDMKEKVIRDAIAQLKGWKWRYGHLAELAEVVEVIENVLAVAV